MLRSVSTVHARCLYLDGAETRRLFPMATKRRKLTRTRGGLVRITGYLREDHYQEFERLVEQEGSTKAAVIRRLILSWIRSHPPGESGAG